MVDPASMTFFTSPSGNIGCSMSGMATVCEIAEHAFAPPPKPPDCELDFGTMIVVGTGEPASFLCHGDTAFVEGAVVLPYDERMSNGVFVCASSRTHMACSTIDGVHGLELSRAAYRVY